MYRAGCQPRLDVLVNNAGIFLEVAETSDYSIENFDRTVTAKIRSVFLMTKFALATTRRCLCH